MNESDLAFLRARKPSGAVRMFGLAMIGAGAIGAAMAWDARDHGANSVAAARSVARGSDSEQRVGAVVVMSRDALDTIAVLHAMAKGDGEPAEHARVALDRIAAAARR